MNKEEIEHKSTGKEGASLGAEARWAGGPRAKAGLRAVNARLGASLVSEWSEVADVVGGSQGPAALKAQASELTYA